jgi:cardiolipin synthase
VSAPPSSPAPSPRTPRYGAIFGAWSARDLLRVPSLLSLSRLLLAGAFPFFAGRVPWALGVLIAAGASDMVDGWYARRFRQESATGAAVDAVADKVFVLTVVVTLLASGGLSWLDLLFLLMRDLGEVALAFRMWMFDARTPEPLGRANVPGKIATLLQYAAVIAILLGAGRHVLWTGAAALAGVVAAISYWRRTRAGSTLLLTSWTD